jgi:uncharacterized protein (TIGR02391 family)
MKSLKALIPDATAIVEMHTADLAGYVLEVLMSAGQMDRGIWNRRNFCMQASQSYAKADQGRDMESGVACSAAWAWLEANGLICRHPEQDNEWYVPTPQGRSIRDHRALRELIDRQELPETLLHLELLTNVRPLFLQARFDTAVFEAFKSLEVTIRTAAKLGDEMIGVALASRAFHPEDGTLTDKSAEKGERVALMNLMTGALGSYKNPASHRRIAISAEEARDMIILASHLLKIVDARVAANVRT